MTSDPKNDSTGKSGRPLDKAVDAVGEEIRQLVGDIDEAYQESHDDKPNPLRPPRAVEGLGGPGNFGGGRLPDDDKP